jgi:hypothetical protein
LPNRLCFLTIQHASRLPEKQAGIAVTEETEVVLKGIAIDVMPVFSHKAVTIDKRTYKQQ